MTHTKAFLAAHADVVLPLAGLVLGIAFGRIVAATNFCTMGAVTDIVLLGDYRRMRAWVLAAAVALAGTQMLAAAGAVDLAAAIYISPRLDWFAHIVGGTVFGVGMVLAGGCVSRNLVRAGAGDIRALVSALIVALVGAMTLFGPLATPRLWLHQAATVDLAATGYDRYGLGAILASTAGTKGPIVVGLAVAALAIAVCLADQRFRASRRHVVAGLTIGGLVVGGWLVTGLARDELALSPVTPTSLTFVRPSGDAFGWLAAIGQDGWPDFGVATVLGTLAGGWLGARATAGIRWQGYAGWADAGRNLLGAALMGFGGVTAQGCTIGQGITGFSTLALGAFLTIGAIVSGGVLAVRILAWTTRD